MKHYAIEIIGKLYAIKEVLPGRGTNPVNGKAYRTVETARRAAEEMGIEIEKVGHFYEII